MMSYFECLFKCGKKEINSNMYRMGIYEDLEGRVA